MGCNVSTENNLQVALRYLQLDSLRKLKQELILKPHFLTSWKTFRDNVIWTPNGLGGAGQKFKSTIEGIVTEIEKREMSPYIALEGETIDISDYTVQDHLIRLVVSVAVATKRACSLMQVAGPESTADQFAIGILYLTKELSYQYLPTVHGRLAQEVDKATGPSIHKQAQDILHNIDYLSREEDVIFSAMKRDLQIRRCIDDEKPESPALDPILDKDAQWPEPDSKNKHPDNYILSDLTTPGAAHKPNTTHVQAARALSKATGGNEAEEKEESTNAKKRSPEDLKQTLLTDTDDYETDVEADQFGVMRGDPTRLEPERTEVNMNKRPPMLFGYDGLLAPSPEEIYC